MKDKTIIVISGFSASGKGTILTKLIESNSNIAVAKSHTTRSLRQVNEWYYSVSQKEFLDLLEKKSFLEWNTYAGNMYGTSKEEIRRILEIEDSIPMLEINSDGLSQVKKNMKNADIKIKSIKSVFLVAEADVLYDRLKRRGTETKKALIERLKAAIEETKKLDKYDVIIVNDDMNETVEKLLHILDGQNVDNDFFDAEKFVERLAQIIVKLEVGDK